MTCAGRRGQTLLEALLACGIIATAVASALTLVTVSINAEKESESGIIAANLGREGLETVRGLRDSNWLATNAWDEGLEGADQDYTAIVVFDPADNAWSLDFAPDFVTESMTLLHRYVVGAAPATIGLMVQRLDPPEGTIPMIFNRLLALDPICDDQSIVESGSACAGDKIGIRVRSTVRWRTGGRERRLVIEERLYDWR